MLTEEQVVKNRNRCRLNAIICNCAIGFIVFMIGISNIPDEYPGQSTDVNNRISTSDMQTKLIAYQRSSAYFNISIIGGSVILFGLILIYFHFRKEDADIEKLTEERAVIQRNIQAMFTPDSSTNSVVTSVQQPIHEQNTEDEQAKDLANEPTKEPTKEPANEPTKEKVIIPSDKLVSLNQNKTTQFHHTNYEMVKDDVLSAKVYPSSLVVTRVPVRSILKKTTMSNA